MMKSPRKRDSDYCARCIYAPAPSVRVLHYLCEYLIRTGKRRGCPPGVGCKKREIRPKEPKNGQEKICRICGARYLGGKYSKLCPACFADAQRRNGLNMVRKRMEKKKAT